MNRNLIIILVAAAALVLLGNATYIVGETEQVIITQFGDPLEPPVTAPGLHLKVPFIQKANYLEKRFLEWDGDPNQVPTKDKRFISVDTYARWRIDDPLLFFERLQNEMRAQTRLDDILDGETRSAVARYDLVEVVRSTNRQADPSTAELGADMEILEQIEMGREGITREILDRASKRAADLGIALLDVRLKRLDYVEQVQRDVFARMIAERNRIASRYRSEGEGEAARIRGEKDRELQRIQSEAYRRAQEIQGEADARATAIYARAYNRDPGFFAFTRSLETYEKALDPESILILTTDADFLRYLKSTP